MNQDNKIFTINVNDIQQRQYNKDRYRMQVYKRLLERCYIKIKSASDNEETFVYIECQSMYLANPYLNYQSVYYL